MFTAKSKQKVCTQYNNIGHWILVKGKLVFKVLVLFTVTALENEKLLFYLAVTNQFSKTC